MTTRLKIVQDILSDVDGDEVNAVGDTLESEQINTICSYTYQMIVDTYDLPAHFNAFKQQASVTDWTSFTLDVNTTRIDWIKYDVSTDANSDWKEMIFMEPKDFIDMIYSRREDGTGIITVNIPVGGGNMELFIKTDKMPQYYTTFDDKTLVFDSFDNSVDGSGLVAAKLTGFGLIRPSFPTNDTDHIELPYELEGLLRNEVREVYMDLYQGGTTRKVNQMANRSQVRAQRSKHKLRLREPQDSAPDYGRKRGRSAPKSETTGTGGRQLPSWWPS